MSDIMYKFRLNSNIFATDTVALTIWQICHCVWAVNAYEIFDDVGMPVVGPSNYSIH